MMNIFIMILVALFMAGVYMFDSPSQKIEQHATETAISMSDMRVIAQCATAMHNAQINGFDFEDVCVEQNGIVSQFVCLNESMKVTGCENQSSKKKIYHYVVTSTAQIDTAYYNDMMDILERYFSDSGTFGLLQDNYIISGGTVTKRIIPNAIIKEMKLQDGQLVYLTQFEVPETSAEFSAVDTGEGIICPVGTAKTYRFGRWQCIGYNVKTNCGGDMVWDSDLEECVADESRRPLCSGNQNAVMVDDVWECISPFPEKVCPNNMIARLNYNTLEWECVVEPGAAADTKKCENVLSAGRYSTGTTLRIPQTSCTDCERLITDPETCASYCVPDPSKMNNASCYPNALSCAGTSRAIYFGFPNISYVNNVTDVAGISVPLDKQHSQNRKFNCLDCGAGQIDAEKSRPPYVAVCK